MWTSIMNSTARPRCQSSQSFRLGGGGEVTPWPSGLANGSLVAVGDAPAGEVVGGQLELDAIARDDADVELLHLARGVGEDHRPLVDLDPVHPPSQGLV